MWLDDEPVMRTLVFVLVLPGGGHDRHRDRIYDAQRRPVSAQGPGAERVRGYITNIDLFGVMMKAFGWAK